MGGKQTAGADFNADPRACAQIKEDITNIRPFQTDKSHGGFRKASFDKQKTELKQKSHVVAGTPGRVLDHIEGTLPLERLAYVVIDEADEMLNMGFIEQVEAIIQHLPKNRVTMLFSATLPDDVEKLSRTYMKDPELIEVKAEGLTTKDIEHFVTGTEEEDKTSLLRDVLITREDPGQAALSSAGQKKESCQLTR